SLDLSNVTSHDAMAMVIVSLQSFAGMWINAFIVAVLCIAWVKKKSFNSNEKILLFLGCIRIGELCMEWVYAILSIFYPSCFFVDSIPQLVAAIRSFFSSSDLWISACLCVFYCIKIANFRYTFFFYLKVKIDRIVPWLLLSSLVLSLVMSILSYDIADRADLKILNSSTQGNFWKLIVVKDGHYFPIFFSAGFIFTTAFTAVILSALLLLISLWRHKHKMQTNSVKSLSVDAHIRAIKSVLSFLIIYSFNFIGFVLAMLYSTNKGKISVFLILIFQHALPVFHSLLLIFSNPNLEKALLRTMPCLKCKGC
ncbi:TA2R7 protein, partial [Todus mexicanus]|nr:TA2R7 protein [Todus mexicanus]